MKNKPFLTTVVIIAIIGFIAFLNGYRFDGFSFTKVPTIIIEVPFAESTIFVDNKEYKTTKSDNQSVIIKKSGQGNRNIIVAHSDRWPWSKNISARNGHEYRLHAFNLKQNPAVTIIEPSDPTYGLKQAEIKRTILPNKENPLQSSDSKISAFIEENTLYVTWHGAKTETPEVFCNENNCSNTIPLTSFVKNINSIALYPNHSDRIILAVENLISVLEIAPIGNQNFQHILQGQNPRFILEGGNLIVSDGEALAEVTLE